MISTRITIAPIFTITLLKNLCIAISSILPLINCVAYWQDTKIDDKINVGSSEIDGKKNVEKLTIIKEVRREPGRYFLLNTEEEPLKTEVS